MKLWRSRTVTVQTQPSRATRDGASEWDLRREKTLKETPKRIKKPNEAKLQRLLEIVEAMEGKPCPTDAQLSAALGYENSASASALVGYLYKTDELRNAGTKRNRQLLVVRSGKKTAAHSPMDEDMTVARWRMEA